MVPRRAHTHPSNRPKATSTLPSLSINTSLASHRFELTDEDSRTVMPRPRSHALAHAHSERQHRWSELIPPQTALTFVAMYDPSDGLLTFSGASLLPSEPPTPPTPLMPPTPTTLDMPDTPMTHAPMPYTPVPSTLADMQSLFDAYFRSASNGNGSAIYNNTAAPARASSTFDGLLCISPMPIPAPAPEPAPKPAIVPATKPMVCGREKPLPVRPPPPPDRDSVFAWSWLGRMAPEDPREPWNANTSTKANGNGIGCAYWPSVGDSGYVSAGCDGDGYADDDGDSFYFTPPELEDPNECSAFSVTTTSTSEYIDVPGRECSSIWSANVLAYSYPAPARTHKLRSSSATRARARAGGAQTQPSSPTSPAQALLHPWRLLRARTSHTTLATAATATSSSNSGGGGGGPGSMQRRASRAASMFAKLGRFGSRDDGESWVCVEVVHTITQRPLRDCER